eukprot:g2092.t1
MQDVEQQIASFEGAARKRGVNPLILACGSNGIFLFTAAMTLSIVPLLLLLSYVQPSIAVRRNGASNKCTTLYNESKRELLEEVEEFEDMSYKRKLPTCLNDANYVTACLPADFVGVEDFIEGCKSQLQYMQRRSSLLPVAVVLFTIATLLWVNIILQHTLFWKWLLRKKLRQLAKIKAQLLVSMHTFEDHIIATRVVDDAAMSDKWKRVRRGILRKRCRQEVLRTRAYLAKMEAERSCTKRLALRLASLQSRWKMATGYYVDYTHIGDTGEAEVFVGWAYKLYSLLNELLEVFFQIQSLWASTSLFWSRYIVIIVAVNTFVSPILIITERYPAAIALDTFLDVLYLARGFAEMKDVFFWSSPARDCNIVGVDPGIPELCLPVSEGTATDAFWKVLSFFYPFVSLSMLLPDVWSSELYMNVMKQLSGRGKAHAPVISDSGSDIKSSRCTGISWMMGKVLWIILTCSLAVFVIVGGFGELCEDWRTCQSRCRASPELVYSDNPSADDDTMLGAWKGQLSISFDYTKVEGGDDFEREVFSQSSAVFFQEEGKLMASIAVARPDDLQASCVMHFDVMCGTENARQSFYVARPLQFLGPSFIAKSNEVLSFRLRSAENCFDGKTSSSFWYSPEDGIPIGGATLEENGVEASSSIEDASARYPLAGVESETEFFTGYNFQPRLTKEEVLCCPQEDSDDSCCSSKVCSCEDEEDIYWALIKGECCSDENGQDCRRDIETSCECASDLEEKVRNDLEALFELDIPVNYLGELFFSSQAFAGVDEITFTKFRFSFSRVRTSTGSGDENENDLVQMMMTDGPSTCT